MTPPRVVYDTVILLQAVANPSGPSWAALALVDTVRVKIVASEATLKEAEDVLSRPSVLKKFPAIEQRAGLFLQVYRELAEVLEEVPKAVELPRDRKDEPFLDLAVASGARYLVTRDKDLTDLMSDPDFTAKYPGLKIVGPVELLRELAPPLKVEEEKPKERPLEP